MFAICFPVAAWCSVCHICRWTVSQQGSVKTSPAENPRQQTCGRICRFFPWETSFQSVQTVSSNALLICCQFLFTSLLYLLNVGGTPLKQQYGYCIVPAFGIWFSSWFGLKWGLPFAWVYRFAWKISLVSQLISVAYILPVESPP